ncbi:MAG: MBL fold metallo-hydrolase [Promethearchaeota archaeon]
MMNLDISGGIKSGNLEIKVITTNTVIPPLLTDEKFQGKVIQPQVDGGKLVAEHGLAMSIEIKEKQNEKLFLLDSGGPKNTMLQNAASMGINLTEVDKLILSHGHIDHFGGFIGLLPKLKEGCEIILSPDAFAQNMILLPKSGKFLSPEELSEKLSELKKQDAFKFDIKLPPLKKPLLQKLANDNNLKIIETRTPLKLADGVFTSGEINLFNENETSKGFYLVKNRKELVKNTFRDEISIYINIKNKGLVVITGCGHAGIVNTIKHGQKLTGINQIYAIIGGFHKEWESSQDIMKSVEFIEKLNPEITCGMHCTGFEFNRIMARHPSHTLGITGTEFHL